MLNYEITLIMDPKFEIKELEALSKSIFLKSKISLEKLSFTKLAYKIKKINVADYYLIKVSEADKQEILEFARKANIARFILRLLIINMTEEKGLHRKKRPYLQKISEIRRIKTEKAQQDKTKNFKDKNTKENTENKK